ncbi:hypothetical protein WH87_16485 [Devosia epidermidihirudinis]|uniref:Uncharacterized protein n=1 Tax=Devosia epidermidihirudinis TaxID=1293439 RepID=A0A0F5Q4U5_9HYPH|nr:hypothetical protein WH87_16485 [Devosia epidermidihirudinis]
MHRLPCSMTTRPPRSLLPARLKRRLRPCAHSVPTHRPQPPRPGQRRQPCPSSLPTALLCKPLSSTLSSPFSHR